MESADSHLGREITFKDGLVGRNLPIWLKIFYFVNLSFFALLAGVAIFSPGSLNVADMTLVSLYFLVFVLISGSYRNKPRTLTSEEKFRRFRLNYTDNFIPYSGYFDKLDTILISVQMRCFRK